MMSLAPARVDTVAGYRCGIGPIHRIHGDGQRSLNLGLHSRMGRPVTAGMIKLADRCQDRGRHKGGTSGRPIAESRLRVSRHSNRRRADDFAFMSVPC